MRAAIGIAAAGVIVIGASAACGATESGRPTASASPSSAAAPPTSGTSTSAAPALLAPPVANPKDARGVAACDVLQPAQLAQLGLDPASRADQPLPAPFSTGCTWNTADVSWGVSLGFDTATTGLSATYESRSAYQHFVPRDIGGHPAVDAQTAYDPEDCYTYVGVADDQALFINVDNRGALAGAPLTPACERLDEIVTMIIGNLPPLK